MMRRRTERDVQRRIANALEEIVDCLVQWHCDYLNANGLLCEEKGCVLIADHDGPHKIESEPCEQFTDYWKKNEPFGSNPEDVAKLAWDAAMRAKRCEP